MERNGMPVIRLLYLCYFATVGSLSPFLPLYYASLGHGGDVIGLIGSITPLTTILVAPLWSALSDHVGNPFPVLYATLIFSLLGHLSLCIVPFTNEAWKIITIVGIAATFSAPIKPLIDSLVMSQIKDKTEYGRLRLWSMIGTGLSTNIASRFLDYKDADSDSSSTVPTWWLGGSFQYLFMLHVMFWTPSFLGIVYMHYSKQEAIDDSHDTDDINKSNKPNHESMVSKLKKIALFFKSNGDVIILYSLIALFGMSAAVLENFCYARVREVGGSGKDIGFSRLLSSIGGAIMFWFSKSLTRIWSAEQVNCVTLFVFAFRFFVYAHMSSGNLYFYFAAESLRGATYACFWSISSIHVNKISPPEVQATMMVMLNTAYNGIGRSAGSIIGGKMQKILGSRQLFLHFAVLNATLGAMSLARESWAGRKRSKVRDFNE